MKRILFLIFLSVYTFSVEYKYIEKYEEPNKSNLEFEEGYNKYSPKFSHYVFTKRAVSVKKEPNNRSKTLLTVGGNKNIQIIAKVSTKHSKWYEVKINKIVGFVNEKNVLKREFNYEKAIEEIEKLEEFLYKDIDKIYFIDCYTPLSYSSGLKKDKYGNGSNQSITAYEVGTKDHYNLQDRTILSIDSEEKKGYNIKVQTYPELILNKKYKKNLKKLEIDGKFITKYIFIDKKNQNIFALMKDNETGNFRVIINGLITTGKNSKYGFETPLGNFLVAISKPVMTYTSDIDTTKVIGDARYAIRFTGGAYLHGIPSLYEPKETRTQRKKITESKLGTYPLSHKCVRNKDEVVKILYEWLGVKSKNKAGHRVPIEPVIVIVR